MIDPKIVERIIETWHRDQGLPHRGHIMRSLPSVPLLKAFIEAAFYASIKKEEGRPLAFSAVLAAEHEVTGPSNPFRPEILRFDSPIPFSVSMIPKLAPAFDPRLSSLAVTLDDQQDQLICWGVLSYSLMSRNSTTDPTANRYTEVPVVPEGWMYFRPDFFTVSTSSPGALTFSRANAILGNLANGDFVPATPTPFISRSLGKYWHRLVEKTEAGRVHGVTYLHYALNALEVLLGEAARRGHGATIVILDATAPSPTPDLYFPQYVLHGEQRLGARIRRCVEVENEVTKVPLTNHDRSLVFHSESSLLSVGCGKLAFETLQRVAQLAAIDGALILNSNFDVLAFGAKLQADRWRRATPIGPDGFGVSNGELFDVKPYGTRHSSALNFAGACPGSIVFVISEDGPIRAFVHESESAVLCWRDCRTSMSI